LADTKGKWRADCEYERLTTQVTERESVAARRVSLPLVRELEVTTAVVSS
jgi:hypothetical protein